MPLTLVTRSPVLYVSWRGFTDADLREVLAEAAALRREVPGGIVYLSRIPASNRVFTSDERALLLDFVIALLPSCASLHHVIEGDGFLKAARRSIVTSMAGATPRPRDFHTYATLHDALAAIGAAYAVNLDDLAPPRAGAPSATRIKSVPPGERASSAFRAAVRLSTERRRPPKW